MFNDDSQEEYENECAGWYFDENGNIVCPYCGTIDLETGKQVDKAE